MMKKSVLALMLGAGLMIFIVGVMVASLVAAGGLYRVKPGQTWYYQAGAGNPFSTLPIHTQRVIAVKNRWVLYEEAGVTQSVHVTYFVAGATREHPRGVERERR